MRSPSTTTVKARCGWRSGSVDDRRASQHERLPAMDFHGRCGRADTTTATTDVTRQLRTFMRIAFEPMERPLPHVEEERQTEGHANSETRRDRHPQALHRCPFVPRPPRRTQRTTDEDDDVPTEKGADPGGKELLDEHAEVEALFAQEGNELGVRQQCADDAQRQDTRVPVSSRAPASLDPRESANQCLDDVRRRRLSSFATRVCKHGDANIARRLNDRDREQRSGAQHRSPVIAFVLDPSWNRSRAS